jgi:L-amino acid N-acyltransferase YncA
MQFSVRPMAPSDWPAARGVYLDGIATGNATFETEAPEWERWDAAHLAACRFVACGFVPYNDGGVLGFAALSPVSARKVYAGVAEVSVYVSQQARGAGVGAALLRELVTASEAAGIWTLQAGIFPENHASLCIHEKCGFRVLGVRQRVGCLAGVWRDVVLLERRSTIAGV